MNLEDYRWLASAAAEPYLTAAASGDLAGPRQSQRWRQDLSAAQTQLIVEQLELRRRAQAKFGDAASRLLFTRKRLEQATSLRIGRYKASRFPAGLAVDLCCGLGGDLLALGARGPAIGVERDPVAALLAAYNAQAMGVQVRLQTGDATAFPVAEAAAWHIDPDRRPGGKRTTQVAAMLPGQAEIDRLLASNPSACIKLAPATEPPPAWCDQAEREWIGEQRECKGLLAWFGPLALRPGQRRATIVDGDVPRTVEGSGDAPRPRYGDLAEYLFEPHAAVLAAGLADELAAEHGLRRFGDGGYLTGDAPLQDAALAGFRVIERLPLDGKRIRAALRESHWRVTEMKARGVPLDERLLKRLRSLPGTQPAVLLLTPTQERRCAVLAERLPGN
ncbi:THUMP-like domain-containing protein [Lignipirellula cremea]|uniref:THUMP-like domain-containing protein n=1 Tax=Lignipirellula cremea TaxID=2528010 RepID=UPI0011A0991D|nr:hypothetical protein [Lignipirellula cremea]